MLITVLGRSTTCCGNLMEGATDSYLLLIVRGTLLVAALILLLLCIG